MRVSRFISWEKVLLHPVHPEQLRWPSHCWGKCDSGAVSSRWVGGGRQMMSGTENKEEVARANFHFDWFVNNFPAPVYQHIVMK